MLHQLEALETQCIEFYDRLAILESKFKPDFAKKQAGFLADKKNGFDAKVMAESLIASDAEYAEYLQLGPKIDGVKARMKIVEMKLKALGFSLEAQRR